MQRGTEYRRAVSAARDGPRTLAGIAAPYESETVIGTMRERIARGAFDHILDGEAEVLALADHEPARLLGRRSAGTLRLFDQPEGLAFELRLGNTTAARDVLEMCERGEMGGMSIGFTVPQGGERRDEAVRVLTRIDLAEISTVASWPAYEATMVEARHRSASIRKLRSEWRYR